MSEVSSVSKNMNGLGGSAMSQKTAMNSAHVGDSTSLATPKRKAESSDAGEPKEKIRRTNSPVPTNGAKSDNVNGMQEGSTTTTNIGQTDDNIIRKVYSNTPSVEQENNSGKWMLTTVPLVGQH